MRPSTAPGTYLFSIIALSLLLLRALESPRRAECQRRRLQRRLRFRAILNVSAALSPAKPSPRQTPVRSIILLAAAGFASQAQVRVTDSLLPQIASDFQTTVGVAAIVLTAYAVTHGSIQFVVGPMADRFGKYRTVAIASVLAAVLVTLCGTASSLPQLALARLATGAVAGWVIPVSMAYLGDVTPSDRCSRSWRATRQATFSDSFSARPMGGVLGDLFGWRNVFFALGGMFALAAVGLDFRADRQSEDARTRPRRFRPPRLCGRLRGRPVQSVRPHHSDHGFHRGGLGLGSVRLYRRKFACALWPKL